MAKDIFDSILEKKYHQLSSSELNELQGFCSSEDEFNALKEVILQTKAIANAPKPSPNPKTKVALDEIYLANYPAKKSWIPYIAVAATICVALFAAWMFFQQRQPEKIQHANNRSEKTVDKQEPAKQSATEQNNIEDNIDSKAVNLAALKEENSSNNASISIKQVEKPSIVAPIQVQTYVAELDQTEYLLYTSDNSTLPAADSILYATNDMQSRLATSINKKSKEMKDTHDELKTESKLSGFTSPSTSATNMAPPRTLHFAGSFQKSMSVNEQKDVLQFLQPKF